MFKFKISPPFVPPFIHLKAGFFQADEDPYNKSHSEIVSYDSRGNIRTLYRTAYKQLKGPVRVIDNLNYTNDGNRAINITDYSGNANGYEGGNGTIQYDINGDMTVMPDKGITNIDYNFLNLPSSITELNTTSFLYSADGTKLRKLLTIATNQGNVQVITEYIDGFQYSTPNIETINKALTSNIQAVEMAKTASEPEAFSVEEMPVKPPGSNALELAFFPTSEGFYDYQNRKYIYQYKDHLGNVRLSYSRAENNSVKVYNGNTYYAFGMNHLNPSSDSAYNPLGAPYNYKYNGKELQETGMYDYGWRNYMPDIGRWNGMDQLSDKFISSSPYAYVMNNLAMFLDPDGRDLAPWLQNLWDKTTSYSTWSSNGYGGFNGGEVPGGISQQAYTSFYNFLAGGGTESFTYWTGGAMPSGSYTMSSDGLRERGIQGSTGHNINIKGFSSIGDFMKDNFVFQVDGKATFGVQAGIGIFEAGIMTGDIGSFSWSNRKGRYALVGAGASVFNIGGNIKFDYITNEIIPTEGSDLLEYYPNNGVLNTEWGYWT